MAAILLDVDGVLHVSGEPIPGGAAVVEKLRRSGHRLRFVTNSTTRSRAELADDLRGLGVAVEDDEVQTTPRAAAHALAGRRVLALVMDAIVGDLEGMELVGDHAEAVLIGGADETEETSRVFTYTNVARAFAELEMGAELYCLHRNRWWQTSRGPLLDSGAFVAGLEYAAQVQATVLGKPSSAYFAAALEALDADPSQAWIVGDDLESDVAGGAAVGLRTALVRTGKFREDDLRHARTMPDLILSSVADLPDWLERS
jgi:HAD superfamily hydrolase (TIGR01458 family)